MFEAYIDESYKSNRVMCVGGWLCLKETWKEIESTWTARIQHEQRMSVRMGFPPISRYHATYCASLKREFDRSKGWDEERQIRFVKKLIDIVGQIRPVGIAVGCSLADTVGAFDSHQEAEKWAYRICMMWCIGLIGELLHENWKDERVAIFHEHSEQFNGAALSAFEAMKADDCQYRDYFVSMAPVRWQDCTAVQSADMLAFEGYKVINLDISSGERRPGQGDEPMDTDKMRKSMQAIIGKKVPLQVRYFTDGIFPVWKNRKRNAARRDYLTITAAQLLNVNAKKKNV